jgi:hypothetical protein
MNLAFFARLPPSEVTPPPNPHEGLVYDPAKVYVHCGEGGGGQNAGSALTLVCARFAPVHASLPCSLRPRARFAPVLASLPCSLRSRARFAPALASLPCSLRSRARSAPAGT